MSGTMSGTKSRTMFGSTQADHSSPFKCPHCERRYLWRRSLWRHVTQIHENSGQFRCGYCHRSFQYKPNFEEHMRVHTGERPFRCKLCPSMFKRKHHLKRHHLQLHSAEKPLRSDEYPKASLGKHHLAHHGPSEVDEQGGEDEVIDGVLRSSEEDVDRVSDNLVHTAITENWVPDEEVRVFDDGGNQRTIKREQDSDGNDVNMTRDPYASNNLLQSIDRIIIDSSDEQAGYQAGQQVDELSEKSSNVGNPILKLVYGVEYPAELCEPT